VGNLAHKPELGYLHLIGTGILDSSVLRERLIVANFKYIDHNDFNIESKWDIVNNVLANFFNYRTIDIVVIETYPKIKEAVLSLHNILKLRGINSIVFEPANITSNIEEYIIDKVVRKDFKIQRTLV